MSPGWGASTLGARIEVCWCRRSGLNCSPWNVKSNMRLKSYCSRQPSRPGQVQDQGFQYLQPLPSSPLETSLALYSPGNICSVDQIFLCSYLTWHSYIPPSLRTTPVICRVQSGDPSWWRRARRGDEEKRMDPEERTVRWEAAGLGPERRTQEREAAPRWVT